MSDKNRIKKCVRDMYDTRGMRNAYKSLVGNSEERKPFRIFSCR